MHELQARDSGESSITLFFINPESDIEMKKIIIISVVIYISIFSLFSQTKKIKGRVISEDFEILPIVSIMIKDTIEVGRTDENGFFFTDIPVTEKKITLWVLGMEPTAIELVSQCDNIEVVMMTAYIYDFMTLRRAERKRKKRYKRLIEIHKQAFEKKIFETEYACYNRQFESYYQQK